MSGPVLAGPLISAASASAAKVRNFQAEQGTEASGASVFAGQGESVSENSAGGGGISSCGCAFEESCGCPAKTAITPAASDVQPSRISAAKRASGMFFMAF